MGHGSASIVLVERDTAHVSFTELFDVVECLPLAESSESHIDGIKRLEYFDGEYYVLCSSDNTGLVVFDGAGRFVRKIGRCGKGRGEYQGTLDFAIDRKGGRILLLCHNSQLIVYGLDGSYMGEKTLGKSILWNIACIGDRFLCTTNHQTYTEGEDACLFYLFDKDLSLVARHTEVLPEYMGMVSLVPSRLKVYDDSYIYSDFYTHRLFVLDKDGNVRQCYEYDKDGLMPSDRFVNYRTFTENQFKYDFIFDNVLVAGYFVTIYKKDSQARIAVNDDSGQVVTDKALYGVLPTFHASDGDDVLSVVTMETAREIAKSHDLAGADEAGGFCIVRYRPGRGIAKAGK